LMVLLLKIAQRFNAGKVVTYKVRVPLGTKDAFIGQISFCRP